MDSSLGKLVLEKDSSKDGSEGYTAVYLDESDVESSPTYAIEQYRPFSKLPTSLGLGVSIGCQINHERIIQHYEKDVVENVRDEFISLGFQVID
jgi:hypothetical protein